MIRITLDQHRFHLATDVDILQNFRWIKTDQCLSWRIGLTTRYLIDRLSREDLMKVSGLRVFDWAYPIDWARQMERENRYGFGKKPWPQLVWCYDPTSANLLEGRWTNLFGYPVFDTDLYARLGELFNWHFDNGLYDAVREEEYA